MAAISVLLCHWEELSGASDMHFKFAAIAVDFFLMVSGFYMMSGIAKAQSEPVLGEGLLYSWKKAKQIYPEYLVALILTFIVFAIQNNMNSIGKIFASLFHYKWEFFYLQMAGFTPDPTFGRDYLMGPGWYLSSLFIAMIFAYSIACRYTKAYLGIIAPLSVLCIYAFILQSYGTLNVGNEVIGCIMLGNLKAFAGISLGALSWYASTHIQNLQLKDKWKHGFTIIEIICWMVLLVLPFISAYVEEYDLAAWLPVFAILLCISNLKTTFVEQFLEQHTMKICGYLGRLSLTIYLFHWAVVMLIKQYIKLPGIAGYLISFGITIMICILFERVKTKLQAEHL